MNQPQAGTWFNYKCDPDCGEIGWFFLPANTGFGKGPLSQSFTGRCPKGHLTTILGDDIGKVRPSPIQKAPAWYPSK
jgi:hypothetical protein